MGFNIFDILVVAYTGYGSVRGFRRGLGNELPRLIAILLFVLTGWGISHWIRSGLGEIQHLTGQTIGGVGFIGLYVASFYLAKFIRGHTSRWVLKHVPNPEHQKKCGVGAGGFRALVLGCTLIVFLGLMPLGFLKTPFSQGSFIGRNLIRFVVPVYDKLSGQ